ncbi:MarR family transcriptional regulator [Capnocytophaga sp. HP1101]
MANDLLKLEAQVCFPLYAASREITQQYAKYLTPLDLTYPQYLVLMVLWETDNLTVNTIGEKLYLDSGTLTPLLKRMEAKELITRTRSKDDERVVLVSLTEAGKKLKRKAKAIPTQLRAETALTDEELDTLRTLANKLLNHK